MDNNTTENLNTKKRIKKRYIVLGVILLLLLALVGFVVYTVKFHTPDTGVNEPPPFATDGMFATDKTTPDKNNTPQADTHKTDPSLLPKSKQKIYNFLLIGQDRVALNTDVIMIINFNTSTHKVNVLQIPRDTYIELSNYNGKINGLYAQYYLNSNRDTKTGARKLADTLEQNLCIKIHNILHINLDGVRKIVDALGGIEINLPNSISYTDERTKQKVIMNAGKQHIDGYQAEMVIRHRSTYLQADIGRIDAQKVVMSGLLQKVKSSFNLSTITNMADVVFDNVTTDVSLTDGVFFAKELLNVDMSQINFMSMVGRNANGGGLSLYVMVRKNMQEMIDTYFNIYDFPISDSIFDANRVFTSTKKYPHLNQHYTNQDITTNEPYSADDINDNSITIPHV